MLALLGVAGGLVVLGAALLTLVTQPALRRSARGVGAEPADAARLRRHVDRLVIDCAPRDHLHPENLRRVGDYAAAELRDAGARVTEQPYADGAYRNVCGRFGPASDEPRVVVGAHCDTHGPLPGADDNASGVAALLELGRLLGRSSLHAPVELVAYALEEHPHAMTPLMGSAVHAAALVREGVALRAMLALEMLGYYRDEPGSQFYPHAWMRWFYPTRANFLAVVGPFRHFDLARRVKGAMRAAGSLPVYSLNAPRWIPGVEQSDHVSYWNQGLRAVMITDTAYLRNPNYHTRYDTPDTLDYPRLAQAVQQIHAAVLALTADGARVRRGHRSG